MKLEDETSSSGYWAQINSAGYVSLEVVQPQLRRLITHNDWTIAYQDSGLIAFDSAYRTVKSTEYKLVLDGVVFVYHDGKLFSGKLKHTPSEKEIRDAKLVAKERANKQHNERIYKKIQQLNERLK